MPDGIDGMELDEKDCKEVNNLVRSAVVAYRNEEPLQEYVQRLNELIPNEGIVADLLHQCGVYDERDCHYTG